MADKNTSVDRPAAYSPSIHTGQVHGGAEAPSAAVKPKNVVLSIRDVVHSSGRSFSTIRGILNPGDAVFGRSAEPTRHRPQANPGVMPAIPQDQPKLKSTRDSPAVVLPGDTAAGMHVQARPPTQGPKLRRFTSNMSATSSNHVAADMCNTMFGPVHISTEVPSKAAAQAPETMPPPPDRLKRSSVPLVSSSVEDSAKKRMLETMFGPSPVKNARPLLDSPKHEVPKTTPVCCGSVVQESQDKVIVEPLGMFAAVTDTKSSSRQTGPGADQGIQAQNSKQALPVRMDAFTNAGCMHTSTTQVRSKKSPQATNAPRESCPSTQSKSNCSIPSVSASSGRAARTTMAGAAKSSLTLQKIEELGRNPKCTGEHCKCLYRETQLDRMHMGSDIFTLWQHFNDLTPDFHKGQALLDYMHCNQTSTEGVYKKVQWKLHPGAKEQICASCWRICAGFAKPSGVESSLFSTIRGFFNAGISNARNEKLKGNSHKLSGEQKSELKVAVTAFLDTWIADNSDPIPEDTAFNDRGPPRVHVDVPRKRDIWEACCAYMKKHYGMEVGCRGEDDTPVADPISLDWFLKILNSKVNVVIHKHKKFSQCVTCFLFKQLMNKCTNAADKTEIRLHRRRHFDTVFAERVIYHQTRNWAKENPELALSMIIDAQTAWRTRGPTLPREVGSGFPSDFEPFGQQLYGCLVHALPGDDAHKGGFFGYMVDDSVKGGGNVTCEIVYRTLAKLQEHRAVWPPLLDIRLDNTTKDNKNKCVFGFFGWLVLTNVFQKVRVRYLSVGHTHEDIDALFGVLMQHLYRGSCFATIEILMDAIYDSFFQVKTEHASGNRPSAKLEHMRATHNWTGWLTTACAERDADGRNEKPAVRKMEKYARRVPDSHRPHEFEFSKTMVNGHLCVVVNYKHWTKDAAYWNKKPIVVFNHTPDVQNLVPALLNPKITQPLEKCVAFPGFEDATLLCCAAGGPKDSTGQASASKLKNCPRCRVAVAFDPNTKSAAMFTEADKVAWAKRFADMTQDLAEGTLPTIKELRTYNQEEPRLPYAMPACMEGPSDAYLSVEPVTYQGYTEAAYQKLLREAGVGAVNGSGASYAVEEVVGVHMDSKGVITAAVIWADDSSDEGGQWVPIGDLNALFYKEDSGSEDETDEEFAPAQTPAEIEEELERDVQKHNWHKYFGREVDEDVELICGFSKRGQTTTTNQGSLMNADYDEHTGHHQVHFPVEPADAWFRTSAQTVANHYINLRLDTLQRVSETGNQTLRFWVKKHFVALPFIYKKLPSVEMSGTDPAPAKRAHRRTDDHEDMPPPTKKPSKAQTKQTELLKQMRETPL